MLLGLTHSFDSAIRNIDITTYMYTYFKKAQKWEGRCAIIVNNTMIFIYLEQVLEVVVSQESLSPLYNA